VDGEVDVNCPTRVLAYGLSCLVFDFFALIVTQGAEVCDR